MLIDWIRIETLMRMITFAHASNPSKFSDRFKRVKQEEADKMGSGW